MATPKREPLMALTPEMRARMEDSKTQEEKVRHGIEVLKNLGMDVTEIEEKLNWATRTRDIIMAELT